MKRSARLVVWSFDEQSESNFLKYFEKDRRGFAEQNHRDGAKQNRDDHFSEVKVL